MKHNFLPIPMLMLLASCGLQVQEATPLHREANIFPDYRGVEMPCNMVAPTFALRDSLALGNLQAVFSAGERSVVVADNGVEGFCIAPDDWRMLTENGGEVSVRIQGSTLVKDEGEGRNEKGAPSKSPRGETFVEKGEGMKEKGAWVEYDAFKITISRDSIDSRLVYRLIEPGYEVWNKMGIYERSLDSYDEEAIITNDKTDGGCINCHSFCNYDRNRMLYHQRVGMPGTYFYDGITTKRIEPSPSFVYPSWHPGGRFVAFSTNKTKQAFHTVSRNRIEVFDYSSDVIVYDTQTEETYTCPQLHSPTAFETFPEWAPDGRTLYFCTADSVNIPDDYDKVRYALCSIEFDPESHTFGEHVDTLYNSRSASFPRVSPDGRYLMFTLSDFGNFSIWHKDADLYLIDLSTREVRCVNELNSSDVESYHCWSSNGKWVVISTRRDDGLYTRPYFSHFHNGTFSKPFALPQSDADFGNRLMKSYNRPEFVK